MKQGDKVTISVPPGDWRHKYDGVNGVVACVYPHNLGVDVDMLDGPDAGSWANFTPEQLAHR